MISGMVFHAFAGYGGSIDGFFYYMESLGVFTYGLPFLILFGLIFGVLSRIQLFGDNKPTYAILAIAVSLMSLQFGFVSQFFSEIFPRLGIGLSIILVAFIILGLLNIDKTWNKGLMALFGVVILVVVVIKSFGSNWYNVGYWLPYNWNWGVVLVIAALIAMFGIIIGNTPKGEPIKADALKAFFKNEKYAS